MATNLSNGMCPSKRPPKSGRLRDEGTQTWTRRNEHKSVDTINGFAGSLHGLLEALPAAIYTTDAAGRITFFNQAAANLWGGRPRLGQDKWCGPWRLFNLNGTPLPHDQCPMAIALKENRAHRGAIAVAERPDGTRVTFAPYPTPLHDASGKLVGAVNMLVDITEKQAFDTLKESEAAFRLLFENNPIPMWVYDRQTLSFLQVNKAAIRHYGYSSEEFLSMSLLDIRPAEDRTALIEEVKERAGSLSSSRSWRHIKANREHIEVQTYAKELPGQTPAAVLVAIIDITERKAAEEELRKTREFLNMIIETIPSTVFVKEPDEFRLVLFNQAGENLLGIRREEVLGRTSHDLFPKEQADFFLQRDQEVLATGKASIAEEEPVLCRNGETRFMRTIKMPMPNPKGGNGPPFLLGISEDITERKRTEERITYLAHYDQLTGLPNRVLFLDRAEQALRDANPAAIMLLDLDDFKFINDSLGHKVGDVLLSKVARAILANVPASGTVARLGGDEFAILLPDVGDTLKAAKIAQTIVDSLRRPFHIARRNIYISTSAGIAMCPSHGTSVEELIANADLALYKAKEDGGQRYSIFTHHLRDIVVARETLDAELRLAFEAGQLELYYQPQIRLGDNSMVGVEALLRWNHPQRGVIAPPAFLNVLEASEFASAVGDWTINEACRQLQFWRDQGVHIGKVAVNLFTAQFRAGNLAQTVDSALAAYKLGANQLELEITENIALIERDCVLEVLRQLQVRGVGIALDDFGTGFASLSTLKRVPLTRLKIDRSFVKDVLSDPQDAAIVSGILTIGANIGLSVTAEGIETEEQKTFLMKHGCEEGQGYLFSRPITASALADQLTHGRDEKRLVANAQPR